MTDYLGAAEATVDSRAYSKLVDYCEGSPAYTGPDDPRYFAHVVAFVHSQRQCFLHHMVSEGIAVPRALDLVRQSVELAAPDRDFPAAMSRERMREVANEMNSRRRASVRFLTAGQLHDLVAGWSEDEWLAYHAHLLRQNLWRAELVYRTNKGWPEKQTRSVIREATALGSLDGSAFAAVVDKLTLAPCAVVNVS
jgi:hypothetical protein